MSKKILVTGGVGYIGSHTVVTLQENGYEVLILDSLENSDKKILEQIHKITGILPVFKQIDLCNKQQLEDFLAQHNTIEAVIHFAAYKAVGESTEFPLKYYRNNVNGLLNLLDAMEQIGCDKLVFSSSCTVYGQPEELPVTEAAPIQKALSPYGNTKRICEEIIADQVQATGLKAIILRYFNPIGAHDSALIGELPIGVPNNLIPYITQTAIGIRKEITVFGDDYDTFDGTCIRDYIHVMDLADAHLVAMSRLDQGKNKSDYEVFNLGTGEGYSVLDIILTFQSANGIKLNYKIGPRRPGDIEKVWADTRHANKELGWQAQLGLDQMLKSAWKWEKKLKDGIMKE